MDYPMFERIADRMNLAATFVSMREAGKCVTDTGKVDFRSFPKIMETAFLYADARCREEDKVKMVPALCKRSGIAVDEFAWRGNAATGKVKHPMAETFVEYCGQYLAAKFPELTFERTVSYTVVKRKEVSADILDALGI
jgi:hypothetical protein